MLRFKAYLVENSIPDNIKDVLSGLKYEIDNKKSSSGRTIIIVRDNDRIDTRDDFFKSLKDSGISAEIKDYASSSIEHIWLKDKFEDSEDNKNKTIIVVFKSAAGGMQETTLNSSIT